jgi:hypothetical protein
MGPRKEFPQSPRAILDSGVRWFPAKPLSSPDVDPSSGA